MTKMLINGCSFSRGPGSWPYHLDYDITNLACAGAGNTYIAQATITELSRRSYDAVTIMWTAPHRVDMQVGYPQKFADSAYTSAYQRTRNDWPEKIVEPVNDQDFVEPNWVFGCGHVNGESAVVNSGAFRGIYTYQRDPEFEQNFSFLLISVQNTLKQLNIPYLFTFYHPYFNHLCHWDLFGLVDTESIYTSTNIWDIVQTNGWYDTDGFHPNTLAHAAWAQTIQTIWQQKLTQQI